jgi:hypothetical protein
MPAYTLAQAIAATGRSRSTLIRAIRKGTISATRDETGTYLVEPAELHRVFPPRANGMPPDMPDRTNGVPWHADDKPDWAALIAAKDALIAKQRQMITDLRLTIDDLRRRLDIVTNQLGEALTQVRLLTDQRPAKRSWWRWR